MKGREGGRGVDGEGDGGREEFPESSSLEWTLPESKLSAKKRIDIKFMKLKVD